MAFYEGKDGTVTVGGTVLGEVQSWSFDVSNDVGEGWGMGDKRTRHFARVSTGKGKVACYLDPDDAGQSAIVASDGDETPPSFNPGGSLDLALYPGPNETGGHYLDVPGAIIESMSFSTDKAGIAMVEINFVANGEWNLEQVA